MDSLKLFETWNILNEIRKKRVCPVIDFTPLRESSVYKDLTALGWEEVTPYQGGKQGNLRFQHSAFPRSIRLNLNGAIWEDEKTGKAHRIYLDADTDPKWQKQCLNMRDYENRIEYLIKKLLQRDGFITREELVNSEGGVEIIKRKLKENPLSVKKLRTVPPSLKDDHDYLEVSNEFGML